MRHRHGFTLIELMIALGATTVLLGVSAGLVHRAMNAHAVARHRATMQHEAMRLSRQLRDDLRYAESLATSEGEFKLTIRRSDAAATLAYTLSDGAVLRELQGDAGTPSHRETYRFAQGVSLAAEQQDAAQRVAIRLVHKQAAPDASPRTLLHVEATLGSRLRIQPRRATP